MVELCRQQRIKGRKRRSSEGTFDVNSTLMKRKTPMRETYRLGRRKEEKKKEAREARSAMCVRQRVFCALTLKAYMFHQP